MGESGEYIGPKTACKLTGCGLGRIYRLALEGSIGHRLSDGGYIQLRRDDLVKLRPDKPNWKGRTKR